MQLTLTYNDLITAAQAHINKMGVTGVVVDVDLKVGRKDRTKTTMTITVGTAETKQQATEAPVDVACTVQDLPTTYVQEVQEEVVEPVEEVVVEDAVAETSPEVEEVPAPRTGLFRGVN